MSGAEDGGKPLLSWFLRLLVMAGEVCPTNYFKRFCLYIKIVSVN